jgi:hypothetical protein
MEKRVAAMERTGIEPVTFGLQSLTTFAQPCGLELLRASLWASAAGKAENASQELGERRARGLAQR